LQKEISHNARPPLNKDTWRDSRTYKPITRGEKPAYSKEEIPQRRCSTTPSPTIATAFHFHSQVTWTLSGLIPFPLSPPNTAPVPIFSQFCRVPIKRVCTKSCSHPFSPSRAWLQDSLRNQIPIHRVRGLFRTPSQNPARNLEPEQFWDPDLNRISAYFEYAPTNNAGDPPSPHTVSANLRHAFSRGKQPSHNSSNSKRRCYPTSCPRFRILRGCPKRQHCYSLRPRLLLPLQPTRRNSNFSHFCHPLTPARHCTQHGHFHNFKTFNHFHFLASVISTLILSPWPYLRFGLVVSISTFTRLYAQHTFASLLIYDLAPNSLLLKEFILLFTTSILSSLAGRLSYLTSLSTQLSGRPNSVDLNAPKPSQADPDSQSIMMFPSPLNSSLRLSLCSPPPTNQSKQPLVSCRILNIALSLPQTTIRFNISISPITTTRDLKQQFEADLRYPAILQSLRFRGRIMDDHTLISSLDLTSDSTLSLTLLLRGGSARTDSQPTPLPTPPPAIFPAADSLSLLHYLSGERKDTPRHTIPFSANTRPGYQSSRGNI